MIRRVAVLVVPLVLVASACGDDEGERAEEGGASTTSEDAELAPWCDDLEPLGPVREGNLAGGETVDEVVGSVLLAYTAANADTYAGSWKDRAHGGTWVFAFTEEPEAHLEEMLALPLSEAAPSSGATGSAATDGVPRTGTVGDSGTVIDAVQAHFTEREISEIQDSVPDLLADSGLEWWGVGQDTSHNRVSIDLDAPDDDARRIIADVLPADAVCFSGSASDPPPPSIDPAAPPTLLPPESADPVAMCVGFEDPIPLSALEAPLGFEDTDDPLAEVLRESVTSTELSYAADSSWRLVAKNDEQALVIADDPPAGYMRFEWTGDRWIWAGGGSGSGCEQALPYPPGVGEAAWELDPAFPTPTPADTEIHVLVTEQACSGASEIGDRLIGPEIRESADQVVIVFGTIALRGFRTCPGNPAMAVTVELPTPLGDRVLLDGSVVPPEPVDAG